MASIQSIVGRNKLNQSWQVSYLKEMTILILMIFQMFYFLFHYKNIETTFVFLTPQKNV